MQGQGSARLRDLPSVTAVLATGAAALLLERFGRAAATDAVRAALDAARAAVRAGAACVPGAEDLALQALARLDGEDRSGLRPLFNLTGTVLHTNLGRALLAEAAIEAAVAGDARARGAGVRPGGGPARRARRPCAGAAVRADRRRGRDGGQQQCRRGAARAQHAGGGREAIVSRGELIEIGGAFRMPDIMARAGARLVEVGTTNRTHPKDYRAAIGPETGVILKVHTSNYRIQGFTAEVGAAELAAIADAANVPLMDDLGSGTLVDLSRYGLPREPTVREAVARRRRARDVLRRQAARRPAGRLHRRPARR